MKLADAIARRAYAMSEPHLSGFRVIVGFDTLKEMQDALQAVAEVKPEKKPDDA